MCLAIPGEIKKIIDNKNAIVDFMGLTKMIAIDLVENVKAGDYVVVHAGFAIQKLDKDIACQNIEDLRNANVRII